MPLLQPLIDALPAGRWGTVILDPNATYDDPDPVFITRNTTIRGGRSSIINSEIQLLSGANLHIVGPTIERNKAGAAHHNGFSTDFYPQNGMITAINATLWLDDVDLRCLPGFSGKSAIHAVNSLTHVRTMNSNCQIDWRNSTSPVLEFFYGSDANIFGIHQPDQVEIKSGADAAGLAAVVLAGSKLIFSGVNLTNFGAAQQGIRISRNSYYQNGAGYPVNLSGFATPVMDDGTRNFIYP